MNRREYLSYTAYTLTGIVLAPFAGNNKAAISRPNIVLIMADDLGYECLSCYGSMDYQTPNLDRMAQNGIRFTRCYSQPLCTPSRVQIMTGRYNHRNYIGFGDLKTSELTFGNLLKNAGYRTCIAGKWQLGRDRKLIKHFGFDEYCLWWLENKSTRYINVGELIQNGEVLPGKKGEYGPDVVSNFLVDFINRHKNESFFCYYPMILTHPPFLPTPDSKNQQNKNEKENFTDMIAYMDKIIGKIVSHLDNLGLLESTLILFVGDNGTNKQIISNTATGKIEGAKGEMTDAGMHVPFIANWKGITPPGKVCDDLIDFSDFMPTLVEATDAKLPADRVFDGQSFLPQLKGQKGNPRNWIFCHYWGGGRRKEGTREFAMDKRWKLYNDGKMFDTSKDPLEKDPLVMLSDEALGAKNKLKKVIERMQS